MNAPWIIVPAFSISGKPAPRKKGDAQLCRHRSQIIAQAYYHLARRAISTPAGYATDRPRLDLLDKEIEPLRVACTEFAEHAAAQGSGRRVAVEIYAFDVTPGCSLWRERVRQALESARIERLVDLRAMLALGDPRAVDKVLALCHNLDVLEPDAAQIVEAARAAKLELGRAARRGQTPGAQVGAAVALLDVAIGRRP